MAICPECHTLDKPFWAPRCHACNSSIGFWRQSLAAWIYNGTIFFLFIFVVGSVLKATVLWSWLGIWFVWCGIPFAIAIIIDLIRG